MKVHRTLPPTAAPLSIVDILNGFSGLLVGKKYLKVLKKELQEYFGVKHVFLVSSGKAALTIILKAIKAIDSRREVIIPAYTCYSVPAAIIKAGLKVSLCDIRTDTYDFNYKELAKIINENTLCIIPSNLFGIPSDIDRINELCRNKNIYIIEDAAQAMGGIYKDKLIGTNGDVGFFSLGRGKNITCGSGGIIVTNSAHIAANINKYYSSIEYPNNLKELVEAFLLVLMTVFIRPTLYWFPAGLSFLELGETKYPNDIPIKKLSGIKAGLLHSWRKNLIKSNIVRKNNTKKYNKYISRKIPCLRVPILMKNTESREKLYSNSRKKGLGLSKMYPASVNEILEIRSLFIGEQYPIAKKVSERLLTLPTHQYLREKDIEDIIELLDSH